MTKFEEFEKDFAAALPGAKCVKITVTFISADDETVRVGVVREGCEDPDEDEGCAKCGDELSPGNHSDLCEDCEEDDED